MYYVKKTLEISAAHRLTLDYESKCTALHGHNWIITVFCRICDQVPHCYRVEVQESKGNVAIYEID